MTTHADFLLVGGGLASATAAETLRTEGSKGSIVIVSAEQELPYHRPPLSKRFLVSDVPTDQLLVLNADYYREQNIEVIRDTRAVALDTQNQTVITDRSEPIQYGKLLIATGSRPLRLNVPGSTLPGIHYLRALGDSRAIKHAATAGKRAVIIGSSFIGMELAASLTKKGVHVTLLAKKQLLFSKLESREISEFFSQYFDQHGIDIVFGDTAAGFRGRNRVEEVITQNGKVLPCDFVAVGVGVAPDIDFLRGSAISVKNGIVVDHYLQTNQPNVFAAGDVANFFDPVFNKRRRIEHWDNAVKQGRLAAKNMLDLRLPYDEVSYFFSDIFDVSFQFFGMTTDTRDRIEIGSLPAKSYALFYMKGDVPRALFTCGRPARETRAIEALIRHRVNIGRIKERLADPTFSLHRIPSQTVLILQGGGALGAFESGVVRALEEKAIFPDVVAGVSIGAFNGAIIASHPKHAAKALAAFWNDLEIFSLDVADERLRRMLSSWQALAFGVPSFFRPRWMTPVFSAKDLADLRTSYYDLAPVRALLSKYVDFDALKSSPVRLLVSAVNVETADLEIFDSYVDELTPDHILASGSLPPAFPWTTIDGKHYWDGGIVSNSPLEQVMDRCGTSGKRIFIVDLYPKHKPLPANMFEVIGRRDEIIYTERIRRDSDTTAIVNDFRKLIREILNDVEPGRAEQLKQRPRYVQLMGDETTMNITRIVRPGTEGEPVSKDYDFSRTSIEQHERAGYEVAKQTLESEAPATD